MEIEVQAMPSTQRREPWNKGKAHRPETTAACKTCLVDPYPIADRGADARLGDVQSGNRRQPRYGSTSELDREGQAGFQFHRGSR